MAKSYRVPVSVVIRARAARLLSLATSLLLGVLLAQQTQACFGPKLYVGAADSAEERVLYEVVALYLKEKTGVESVRVALDDKDAGEELRGERVDLALARAPVAGVEVLLAVGQGRVLLSGRRPLEDLQFTTVAPALKKLDRLLQPDHLAELAGRVAAGAPPAAAARRFLMTQGWI